MMSGDSPQTSKRDHIPVRLETRRYVPDPPEARRQRDAVANEVSSPASSRLVTVIEPEFCLMDLRESFETRCPGPSASTRLDRSGAGSDRNLRQIPDC